MIERTCCHCDAVNVVAQAGPHFCKACGHRTDVPRRDCDCPACCPRPPRGPLRKKKAFVVRQGLTCKPEWSSADPDCRRATITFETEAAGLTLKNLSPDELRRLAKFLTTVASHVELPLG